MSHLNLSRHPNLTILDSWWGRKNDNSEEVVFWHAGPYSVDEELCYSLSVGAINDMTPGGAIYGFWKFDVHPKL